MYTEIIFKDKGEKQKWLGSEKGFKTTYPKAKVLKIEEHEKYSNSSRTP